MILLVLLCIAIGVWYGWYFYQQRQQAARRQRYAACLTAIRQLERDLTPLFGWHAGYELARREAQRLEHAISAERLNIMVGFLYTAMGGSARPSPYAQLTALQRQHDAVQEWLRNPTDDIPWDV